MDNIIYLAWLIAGLCFIFSLAGLSRHETSRRGNNLGMIGMLIAVAATVIWLLARRNLESMAFESGTGLALMIALVVGAGIGIVMALRVQMTAMPELVALLHSFVGLAAVLVGFANYWAHPAVMNISPPPPITANLIHLIETALGVFIGGVTFTGSIVAWGKLNGKITSKPLTLRGRHALNLSLLGATLLLTVVFCFVKPLAIGLTLLTLITIISFVLGAHLVLAIGGADMPVVVSMLNSYSGWAAAATGFMLQIDLLIVTGALVGSSGAILSYIMCHAMNRSFISVILGGFGGESSTPSSASSANLTYHQTTAEETAEWMLNTNEVIIVPGYGMAVAQAQHPIREICEILRKRNVKTRFAIHPVAGRLPGHMNVLLAEANVPYDIVLEMEEINEDFPHTGVVLIIGANDIVNPGAQDDPSSPIYGMPVLEVWKAEKVVILKRSMATGYSGVDNPLFYRDNSAMLFGDAKASVDRILQSLRA